MPKNRGIIALMGSGELTATMVEVHKLLLRRYGASAHAVFIDTPAGFQLNADQISLKAIDYFKRRVGHNLRIASFKSAESSSASAEQAFDQMRRADFLLVGPGSPTYALNQWQNSPVPDILNLRVNAGGCLVAASAAALTVGRLTLPVYEIYKVGAAVHWVDGLDLLGRVGMDLAVIPHWNNAEGGNHDTRFCFMGADRLDRLMDHMPRSTRILGLDEHTALIIDLARSHATIEGVGQVVLKDRRQEMIFARGDHIPLSLLRGETDWNGPPPGTSREKAGLSGEDSPTGEEDLWGAIHARADEARRAIDEGHDEKVAANLLELERLIWRSRDKLEEQNAMGAAREVLREVLSALTAGLASRPKSRRSCLSGVLTAILDLRDRFRSESKWDDADAVRACLDKAGIRVTDSPTGATWHLDE
jgi:cyanophycinase-like exopeptidase